MRINTSMFSLLVLLVFNTSMPIAQAPPKMPSNARDLLVLAAESNDLTGSSVKPWHLKATFKVFDEKGEMTDEGTFEESWVSPNEFKRSFTSKEYTQTDFGTSAGVLRSGRSEDVEPLLQKMRRNLAEPLPEPESLGTGSFAERQVVSAGTNLRCIDSTNLAAQYCIAADQPILRIASSPIDGLQVLHNRILSFQGHYVPGDLSIVRAGNTVLSAHLESIEAVDPVNDAEFSPPSDATLLPRRVNVSSAVAVGMLAYKVAPEYPLAARAQRIQGTVVLEALIGTDGHIKDLHAISGPPVLRQPALDAVHKWRYRPFLLNGSPVEVMTSINVIFTVGR